MEDLGCIFCILEEKTENGCKGEQNEMYVEEKSLVGSVSREEIEKEMIEHF